MGKKSKMKFRRVQWTEVMKALNSTEWLPKITKGIRRRGFFHGDFERSRPVRAMVANSLTTIEDRVDNERSCKTRDVLLGKIREVRRRLEWELWP